MKRQHIIIAASCLAVVVIFIIYAIIGNSGEEGTPGSSNEEIEADNEGQAVMGQEDMDQPEVEHDTAASDNIGADNQNSEANLVFAPGDYSPEFGVVVNPGFEGGREGWMFGPDWGLTGDASYMGSISARGDGDGSWSKISFQIIEIQPHTDYMVSWYAKGNVDWAGTVCLQPADAHGCSDDFAPHFDIMDLPGFTRHDVTFNSGVKAHVRINLYNGNGIVHIDEMRIKDLYAPPLLLLDAITPAPGAAGVPIDTDILLVFDDWMDIVTLQNIVLREVESDNFADFTIFPINDLSFSLVPEADLKPGATYEVLIPWNVRSKSRDIALGLENNGRGAAGMEDTAYTFTTEG